MEIPNYGIYANEDWPSVTKGAAAMISKMDHDVGIILRLLQELELDKKTFVFFTSDNGPHSEGGHKHETFNSNGPLRGFKRDLYEGGIRVPAIAYWPGTIKPGSTYNKPLAFWDWLPTVCDLANVSIPEKIDGISFVQALKGNFEIQNDHDFLYWKFSKKEAIRKGKWKGVITGQGQKMELYNLEIDLGEQTNLALMYPEKIKELNGLIQKAKK